MRQEEEPEPVGAVTVNPEEEQSGAKWNAGTVAEKLRGESDTVQERQTRWSQERRTAGTVERSKERLERCSVGLEISRNGDQQEEQLERRTAGTVNSRNGDQQER